MFDGAGGEEVVAESDVAASAVVDLRIRGGRGGEMRYLVVMRDWVLSMDFVRGCKEPNIGQRANSQYLDGQQGGG